MKEILERFKNSKAGYLKINFGWRKFVELEKKAGGQAVAVSGAVTPCGEGQGGVGEERVAELVSLYVGRFKKRKEVIKEGESVKKGEILGTVDSMGIAHEITAPSNGVLTEVGVKDQDIVEYEQILFKIKETV